MLKNINSKIHANMKNLKRRYTFLKIKWILLFVLPILVVVLAYQVTKQFLKLKMQKIDTNLKESQTGQNHGTETRQRT